MSGDPRVEKAKFELGPVGVGGGDIDAGDLPWAYGEDRITAVVRDPDSAYLYWEVTDESIAAARAHLGPAGEGGWCNLRVYDVTGSPFDGTNANDYFDIRVDRADREHYVMLRRPASSMTVEVGVKTHEGFFRAIARSGRADFPRGSPSPSTTREWMTVLSGPTREAPPCVTPFRSRYAGPDPLVPRPGDPLGGDTPQDPAGSSPGDPSLAAEPAAPPGGGALGGASEGSTLSSSSIGGRVERWSGP